MPTAARTYEAEMRRVWADYAASLEGLEGADYDKAEQEAWRRLQDALEDLQGGAVLRRPTVG